MTQTRELHNSKPSIRGFFNKCVLPILCGGLLFVFGCGAPTAPTENSNATSAATIHGDEYLTLENDALVMHRFGQEETTRIPASTPSTAVRSSDNTALAWIEEAVDGHQIVYYATTTGERTVSYWSKHPMTDMRFSPHGDTISFREEGSLYVLPLVAADVRRVAEHVTEYAWSPDNQTIAISTEDATEFVRVNANTEVTGRTTIRSEQPMRGLAFRNANTLIGFILNSGLEFIAYDSHRKSTRVLEHWTATAEEQVVPVSVTTAVSPDQTLALIEETTTDGSHRVTQFVFATEQRIAIPEDAEIVGWYSPSIPILFVDFHLVAKEGILQDAIPLSATPIDSATFVRSFHAL